MTDQAMTPERLLMIIEAYGARRAAWPEAEQDAAEALLGEQPELFVEALAQAELTDSLLDEVPQPAPSSVLFEAVMDGAPKQKTQGQLASLIRNRLLPKGLRLPTGAVAASLGIGMITGYSYASPAEETYYTSSAGQILFEGYTEDYDSWLSQEGGYE